MKSRAHYCFLVFILMALLFHVFPLNAQNSAPGAPAPKKAGHPPVALLFDSCYWASDAPALLANAICSRLAACCAGGSCGAVMEACNHAMDGEAGKLIWDEFGLVHENELSTPDLRSRVLSRSVLVNTSYLCSCIDDLTRISCEAVRANYTSDYLSVESLIPNSGSWCPSVFSVPPPPTP
jgi:hypothetical protein